MDQYCTLQIYQEDEWLDCAIVEIVGRQQTGWQAATRTSYLFEYAISYMDLRDGHALAYHLPVNVQNTLQSTWPAFLMDLLPQGYGRKELLRQLNFSENTQEQADWALLKAGA
ncbi:HipA N-terminal domain-containing protein, partial [Klebsiella pneumoniae]|nr:HipA N-terminal domain-containing protein [Klebsiella pneumoniae]